MEYLRASGSMPCLSKIVEINGNKYLDGGIADSIPLRKAKEMANKTFTEYMDLKKEIIESGSYADPVIRNIFNQKKNEWRSASMDVIKTKTALYSCEIEYNNIIEYVSLTTEYIKFLEQNQKEKV